MSLPNTSAKKFKSFLKALPLVLFFILPLVTCSHWGQVVQKKQLTPADYHLWGDLTLDKMAPNEKWASYKMTYENDIDTLFVRSILRDQSYAFPGGKQSLFTKDNLFVCYSKEEFIIMDPQSKKREILKGVTNYAYSPKHDLLFIHLGDTAYKNTLIIKSPLGKTLAEISDVANFSLSPLGDKLLYSVSYNKKQSVFVMNPGKLNTARWLLKATDKYYDDFTWHKSGKAVAFYAKTKAQHIESILYYVVEKDTVFEFDSTKEPGLPPNTAITGRSFNPIVISDDLQRVFFKIQAPRPSVNTVDSPVEIWNTNDKWVYPQNQKFGRFDLQPKVMLWKPASNSLSLITTDELPAIMLSGDQQYAILSDPKAYEPQFDYEGVRDYYIMDLATLDKTILLGRQSGFYLDMAPSPAGKYIAYFREHNWWIYDLASKKHTNITQMITVPFSGRATTLKWDSAFGNPAWSHNDQEILLYDEFDIWAVNPQSGAFRRLTHGREAQIRYRIPKIANKNEFNFLYDGRLLDSYDLEKEIILRAQGADGKTGYYSWTKNTGEKPVVYQDAYTDQLLITAKSRKLCYIEQKFDLPYRLVVKDKAAAAKTVFQSNPQHFKFYWGKSELIHFQNSKKQNVKGVLFYPAHYDPQKKYPMVVHIYEVQSQELHKYSNPTLHNEPGFNASVLNSEGYFLFQPDILHVKDSISASALDCVVAGTKKIIELGLVDPAKIGLMGHSFGGYETAFISNHTRIFATAIASGAITDLKSMFLSIGWSTTKPEMWRFATQQFSLNGKNPLQHPEDFNRNSPLESLVDLQIPLLMWTGKEDKTVDWHQSIEYHLALRRLGKKSIMLVYPKEGHTLTNPVNQKDLSQRVLQWFGHYLKGEKNTPWINNGML